MRHILIILAIVLLASCATLQPQTAVEPDAATAKYKAVDAYVFVPRKAEDTEASKATITGDTNEVRWVPVKISVNVPVPEGEKE